MVGAVIHDLQSIGNGAYLQAKPAPAIEWVIHNIYHPNSIELKIVDGSGNECSFYEEADKGFITNCYMHLTDSHYLRIYNVSGGDMYLAYDGIITLEP